MARDPNADNKGDKRTDHSYEAHGKSIEDKTGENDEKNNVDDKHIFVFVSSWREWGTNDR